MDYSDTQKKILWASLTFSHSVHTFFKLMQYYGDIEVMWSEFDPKDEEIEWVPTRQREQLSKTRDMAYIDKLIASFDDICFVTYTQEEYPALLFEVEDAPIVLYYRGKLPSGDCVAVVGTRTCTKYGKDIAFEIGNGLAKAGITVVSGGARGIDTLALLGAMEGKGKPVAVFGCGVDFYYPEENSELFDNIIETGGCLMSEYLPGTKPEYYYFPARNRLISGLSVASVIVESGKKSGANITARFAAEQGRDVFCVPGSIKSKSSEGTNGLIRDGAKVLLSVDDILEEYGWCGKSKTIKEPVDLTNEEKQIYDIIQSSGEMTMDGLSQTLQMPMGKLSATMTMLEIKGVVRKNPGNVFTV